MELLLSVVLPTQNRAGLLTQSLDSLTRQTLPKEQFEVVIVDDGSTDRTPQVCEEFGRRLQLRYHRTPASGLGAAKSLAVMLAQAPLVYFFDDDDVATPNTLQGHLDVHARYPSSAFAALNETTWAPGLEVNELMRYATDIGQFLFSFKNLHDGQVLDYTYFWGGRSSAKRHFLMQHGLFDPDFTHSPEDIELGYRLKRHGLRVVFTRNAMTHMNRTLTFEQFCARAEGQGRSLHRFTTLHPVPEVLRYAEAAGARERWAAVAPELEERFAEIEMLESRETSLTDAERSRLHELYGWGIRAQRLKGFVEASEAAGSADGREDDRRLAERWRGKLAGRTRRAPGLRRRGADRAPGKRILVVDHYLPVYDRASGARRLWEVLNLLVAQGHSVSFVARDGKHGRRYVEELEALGVEVFVSENSDPAGWRPEPFDVPALLRERDFDLAYLSFFIVAEQWQPLLRTLSPRTRTIVDSVDLHWVRERREAELKGDPVLLRRAEQIRIQELAAYAAADAVVVVTERERDVLAEELPDARIHVIPNVHAEAPPPAPLAGRDGILFVGFFGHTPNVDAVTFLVDEVMPLVRAELPDVKLTIVGADPTPEIRALGGDGIEVTGYVPSTEPYLASHRVSVAPLRYGAGLKGKVGEALAAGLPVVTTSIGVEGMPAGAAGNALLVADDPAAIAESLVRLHRDDELWQRLSAAGRELVASAYAPEALAPRLAAIVEAEAVPASEPDASIIVLVRDQLELTRACLESIEAHTPERHEVILVDNGSLKQTAAFLHGYAERNTHVRLVANVANRGFAGGNNLGLALARGRNVVFLNNDTVVTEGWLTRMLAVLDSHPETGLVGPLTNRAAGRQVIEDAAYETADEREAFAAALAVRRAGETIPVQRLIGFCLAARRELVETIGGLDPRFGAGNLEDDDYCLRAAIAGFECRIAADAYVHHVGGSTFTSAGIDYHQSLLRNWGLFKEKWGIPASVGMGDTYEVSEQARVAVELYQPLPRLSREHELLLDGRIWKEVPVHRAYAAAVETLSGGDPQSLRRAFSELARWNDPHRRYQLRKQLVELTFVQEDKREARWVPAFLTAGDELLTVLEETPAEPVLLNYAGVLLYELAELEGAQALFKAAQRLDPTLQQARDNLAAVRQLKGARLKRPAARFAAELRELGARAKRVAAAARPADGLTLSLCMIVKDEEEMLPGCLAAAKDAVDEIVVVDTGSSDRTVEIAESFGAKVVHFPWNGSFADARNVSIEHATGDWIMYLDADEHLVDGCAAELRAQLGKTWREAFYLVETNLTGMEGSGEAITHLALRLWRNRPEYRFEGRIHEQKTRSMPNYLPERFEETGVRILHYGYLKNRIAARDKSRRNIELLEQEAAEQGMTAFAGFNLGSEYVIVGESERARTYFEDAWATLRKEPVWPGEAYAPMLVARLAAVRRDAGDIAGTRALAAEGLSVWPDFTDLEFKLALCAVDEKDWPTAERHARRCLEMGDAPAVYSGTVGSGTYLALALLGQLREAQGDPVEAEECYRRSLAEHPEFSSPVLALANLMFRRGASPDEVDALLPKEQPSALMFAASACYEAGHAAVAADWFLRVLAEQPANGAARVGLVEALLAERRYDEALEHARQREDGSPVKSQLALSELFVHALRGHDDALGATLARVEIPEVERRIFEAWHAALSGANVPETLPADAIAATATLLEALLKVTEFDAFQTLHGIYARIDVDPATRSELLAAIYFRRGYLDSAADEWVASLQAEPAAGPLLGLAHVAAAKGLDEDAVVFCEEALSLDPGHPQAATFREALLAKAAA